MMDFTNECTNIYTWGQHFRNARNTQSLLQNVCLSTLAKFGLMLDPYLLVSQDIKENRMPVAAQLALSGMETSLLTLEA